MSDIPVKSAPLHPAERFKQTPNMGLEEQKLRQAAADFEALFVKQMLKSMRKATPEWAKDGPFKKNHGEKLFRDMLDGEYAKLASSGRGGFGIKEALLEQFKRGRRGPVQQQLHQQNPEQALRRLRAGADQYKALK